MIKSKEVILLTISLAGSFLLAIILSPIKFNLDSIYVLYAIIIILAILIIVIGWAIGAKNKEIEERLDEQETNQKKLNEKLKIHEQLIDIKAELKELQKRCLKNE